MIITSLQKCVQAVLLGRTHLPDWLGHGIPLRALTGGVIVEELPHGQFINPHLHLYL